jgi:hypothetical protein
MNGMTRAGATLLAAGAAGALLWVAAQIGRGSTGGYWAAYGIVAGAGLVLAAAQVRGRTGHPRAALGLNFMPVLIAAGWVLLAMQPHSNWFRHHVLAWSGDIGIRDVVRDLGTWLGVLAFGIGYTLGLVLEPMPRSRPVPQRRPELDRAASDEPVTAERREVTGRGKAAERDGPAEPVRARPAR